MVIPDEIRNRRNAALQGATHDHSKALTNLELVSNFFRKHWREDNSNACNFALPEAVTPKP